MIKGWGGKIVNTITSPLTHCGFKASLFAGVIEVEDLSVASALRALKKMGLPSEFELVAVVPDKYLDKYDEYLPESLLAKGYGAKAYDIEGTCIWLQKHLQ
ncbi:Uncharacterised protein [Citrobacter freundii]|nr:Uncharacterised protein [Citrobacter freundii]SUX72520.1 Uncharacterised protein [Citrobacter freundii]